MTWDAAIQADTHGMIRNGAHDTEEAAAEVAAHTRSLVQQLVLSILMEEGDMTDEELDVAVRKRGFRLGQSSHRARRSDLTHDGLVIDTGGRRRGSTGRDMIVWHAVQDGELVIPADPKPATPPADEEALSVSIANALFRKWQIEPRLYGSLFTWVVEAVRAGMRGHP